MLRFDIIMASIVGLTNVQGNIDFVAFTHYHFIISLFAGRDDVRDEGGPTRREGQECVVG